MSLCMHVCRIPESWWQAGAWTTSPEDAMCLWHIYRNQMTAAALPQLSWLCWPKRSGVSEDGINIPNNVRRSRHFQAYIARAKLRRDCARAKCNACPISTSLQHLRGGRLKSASRNGPCNPMVVGVVGGEVAGGGVSHPLIVLILW